MAVTFGLSGLPDEMYDEALSGGSGFLDAYERCVDVVGPEFTAIWASDHFQKGDSESFECWTRLTYLAARHPRFKVGSLVLGQAYRNPALLAKMASTLQFISDGRLILGIGAAWHEEEFRSYNFPFGSRKERVDQLIEAIKILRLMFDGGPATFKGEHYAITEAYCRPAPATPIPIIVGAWKPRMLRVAAEYGDGWNFDANPAVFATQLPILREHLAACGRNFDDFMLSLNVNVSFPENRDGFVDMIPTDYPEYDLDAYVYGPTPEDAIRRLTPFVEAGATHFQVGVEDLRCLKLFASEVAPALVEIGAATVQ
jgi:alkanesulfonate monooxygenase SsuD/methylene tetrahydromethanopterin reductase-like flavin-dependent oxidoreductase (luciferase family)